MRILFTVIALAVALTVQPAFAAPTPTDDKAPQVETKSKTKAKNNQANEAFKNTETATQSTAHVRHRPVRSFLRG